MPKIQRRQGEVGQQEDRHILEFMKLIEIVQS